jgi:hypothetical protein
MDSYDHPGRAAQSGPEGKPLRRALILCAAFFAGCAATGDIVPAGQDTYKIAVPTSKIPATTCDACVQSQKMRFPDIGVVDDRAQLQAREYCARLKKRMVVTDASFDMGPGFALTFNCVPP